MPRILIIEDERSMRTALADCLQAEGYRVLTAADGQSGLQRALEEQPDLILLDIMMPRLDGFALCAELRRLGRQVPILMLTAKGQVQDRVRGLDAGADDYLVKPFSTDELLARVRALLRRIERPAQQVRTLALGQVRVDFAAQQFLDVVWGVTAFPTTRTVDNHIAMLRAKIEPDPENPRWIKTVHGAGYRLDLPEGSDSKSE